jgi:site-specific DNA recombinase
MDAQVAAVERYVEHRGWGRAKIYRENGVSGYKRERPALARLLADARAGKLDVVVFPSIDRAARSVTDMIDIDAALREANVAIVFVREGVDTSSPTGQFFRNICASVAQFEGKLIHERLLKGLRMKASRGGYTGGPLPYGYRREAARPGTKGRAVVVPEEADVVRLVFRLRLDGKSYREIAGELRSRGVATKRGGRWRYGTVGGMLGCAFHAGWVKHDGGYVRGSHEAIVSVETFNRAQQVFHSDADRKRNEAKRTRLPEGRRAPKRARRPGERVPKGGGA